MPNPLKGKRWKPKGLSGKQTDHPGEDNFSLSEEDILGLNVDDRPSLLFLGAYSRNEIERILHKYGIYEELEQRGFGNIQLTMDTRDPYRQRLALHSVIEALNASFLLAEIVVKRDVLTLPAEFSTIHANHPFDVLVIEWLTLQDPRLSFTPRRPRLPGQQYPGLGIARTVLKLLIMACKRLDLAGIVNVPQYFHNAQIYSVMAAFIDPEYEGKRQAIARDLLSGHSLAKVSWAVDLGCVRENDQPFQWFTSKQIVPLIRELKDFLNHPEFLARVAEARQHYHFTIDEKCWEKKKHKIADGEYLT